MRHKNSQSGQTLIEVIIALLMLTIALVAGLGLAIYSSSRNVNNRNQIIATNLAREGIEAVRIMRDTNWLAASDPTPSNSQFTNGVDDLNPACNFPGGNTYPCYPEGFMEPYSLRSQGGANRYRMVFNPSLANRPNLMINTKHGSENYFLCLESDGTYRHGSCSATEAQFARQVTISSGSTSAPFTIDNDNSNNGHSPEKVINSIVVWKGKGCDEFDTNMIPSTFSSRCKITVTERLTNWKDY